MICDAHVHVGYFPRKGWEEPFYYSPRRILGILDRAGVDEYGEFFEIFERAITDLDLTEDDKFHIS